MSDYSADSIQVLEGLEHVRRRPAMYLGSLDVSGLAHMVCQVLDGAYDEALEGRASRVAVRLGRDGSVAVEDDGQGIPVRAEPRTGRSVLEVFLTVLATGCRCGCGRHASLVRRSETGDPQVTNALSSTLEAETSVDGRRWRIRCARGRIASGLDDLGPAAWAGTRLTFTPDPEIFGDVHLDADRIVAELRWRSALTPEVTWELLDERGPRRRVVLRSSRGLSDLVHALVDGPTLPRPLATRTWSTAEGLQAQVAWLPCAGRARRLLGFVNCQPFDEGDHVEGLRLGLSEGLEAARSAAGLHRRGLPGLVAAVSLELSTRGRGGWSRDPLDSPPAHELVRTTTRTLIERWALANPTLFRAVFA